MPSPSAARQQGTVVEWSDEKRCGFIRPRGAEEGEPLVFLPASNLVKRGQTLAIGDVVTYDLTSLPETDQNRRLRTLLRAERASLLGDEPATRPRKAERPWIILLGLAYVACLGVVASDQPVARPILVWVLISSVIALIAYGIDKDAAREGNWRVSESTLHFWAVAGGWPGAAVAQHFLRHKTRKAEFRMTFFVAVAFNIAVVAAVLLMNAGVLF